MLNDYMFSEKEKREIKKKDRRVMFLSDGVAPTLTTGSPPIIVLDKEIRRNDEIKGIIEKRKRS